MLEAIAIKPMTSERLMRWRMHRRLTVSEMAAFLKCPRRTIQRWERCKIPLARAVMLALAVDALDQKLNAARL